MIETHELTKKYGDTVAVDHLTFRALPGRVTGFLGPNGAGKSTTMRMILGLDAPTSGSVTVNGTPYRHHHYPLHEVGALLEAKAIHPGRSSYNHLLAVAAHAADRDAFDLGIDQGLAGTVWARTDFDCEYFNSFSRSLRTPSLSFSRFSAPNFLASSSSTGGRAFCFTSTSSTS